MSYFSTVLSPSSLTIVLSGHVGDVTCACDCALIVKDGWAHHHGEVLHPHPHS
jgi:hypothetical protein